MKPNRIFGNFTNRALTCKESFKQQIDKRKNYKCILHVSSMAVIQSRQNFPFYELSDCSKTICPPHYMKCKKQGYCVHIKNICDGVSHCSDNEDETDCGLCTICDYNLQKKLLNFIFFKRKFLPKRILQM